MATLAALLKRRFRAGPDAPPAGAHEVRLLASPDAAALARAVSVLAALDQAADALRLLRKGGPGRATGAAEALRRLALLRLALVQFVDALAAAREGPLDPAAAIEGAPGGETFHRHLRAFRAQLDGCHPRMVGETETVALLRRVQDQPVLITVATRTLRPDRLTSAELARMSDFVDQVRAGWAEQVEALRAQVADQTHRLSPAELDSLPPAPAS